MTGSFFQPRFTEQAARLKCFLDLEDIEITQSVMKDATESVSSLICVNNLQCLSLGHRRRE